VVVHGEDGMDELSTVPPPPGCGRSVPQGVESITASSRGSLGLARAGLRDLAGGETRDENARIIREEVLAGRAGPRRDIAALNAAAALVVAGRADGTCGRVMDLAQAFHRLRRRPRASWRSWRTVYHAPIPAKPCRRRLKKGADEHVPG
jgi:anthranilate phosphoribosyltransferase